MDAVGNGAGLSAWHCCPSWPAHTPVLLGRSNSTGQAGLSSWADRSLHLCDQPGSYLSTPHPKPSNDEVHCQAGQTPKDGVQVRIWSWCRSHSCGVLSKGGHRVLTCLEGCNGTFLVPSSQVGSASCPGLPTSRACLFSFSSADGQFSDSRGFLTRRWSHFSFRSCGFKAISFCRGRRKCLSTCGNTAQR